MGNDAARRRLILVLVLATAATVLGILLILLAAHWMAVVGCRFVQPPGGEDYWEPAIPCEVLGYVEGAGILLVLLPVPGLLYEWWHRRRQRS